MGILLGTPDGYRTLTQKAFDWKHKSTYELKATAQGKTVTLFIDGQKMAEAEVPYEYGMYGVALPSAGEALFGQFRVGE